MIDPQSNTDDSFTAARWAQIRTRADELKALYGERDGMYAELKRMYLLEWGEEPQADWIKATMSPRPYNAIRGAVRLMTATEPQISVPFDEASAEAKLASEQIERAAKAMWSGAGRVRQKALHHDVVLSALLFDEIDGDVERVADLQAYAARTNNIGLKARLKYIGHETPYMFTLHDPGTCYADFDMYGLRARLRRAERRWGEVRDAWGQYAENLGVTFRDTDKVTICDYYDWELRATWIENASDRPLLFARHGLEFMPVISQMVDGSTLFGDPSEQRQPFFYALHKSGLWKRENLSLTVAYSLLFALGSNPLFQMQTDDPSDPNNAPFIDRTIPGGVALTRKGQPLSPLMQEVVNPEHYRLLELSGQLGEESTISRMTLGTAPTGSMPFSAISLLSQSGRLPLVATREQGGAAIAAMLTKALMWYKAEPSGVKLRDKYNKAVELTANQIPEYMALKVILEPDVPTDKLQLANIAGQLTSGERPLASYRWVRENILQMGQSREMDKEIYMEQRIQQELARIFQSLNAQDQMKLQQMAGQMQQQAQMQAQMGKMQARMDAPAPAPTGSPAGYSGGELDGNESAYLNGQVQPGAPLSGPLPARTEA